MLPPRLSLLLLRIFVTPDRQEDTQGDMEEMHSRRVARFGRGLAWWITSFDSLLVAGAFVLYRLRENGGRMGAPITWSELKQGLRLIKKQPLLNLTALLTLATGIGLVNVGFSVMDAALFSALPYENGDRFIRIDVTEARTGNRTLLDLDRFHLLADEVDSLDYLGAKNHEQLNLFHEPDKAEQVTGVEISPDAFEFLPVRPLLGRALVRDDGATGAQPVVLIRESLWESRYGRALDVIGATLDVSGIERTIVGVLPDDFEFPNSPRVWVPLDQRYLGGTREGMASGNELFGIRAAGVSSGAAQQQVDSLSARFEAANPAAPELRLAVRPYTAGPDPAQLWIAMGSFVSVLILVLLVIASNVGNLIMVRTAYRSRELSVRSALGAGRLRLVGQLFAEVAILVGMAAVLGFFASARALTWLRDAFTEAPFWMQLDPNPRTVVAAALIALITAAAAGLAPALKATRAHPGENLKRMGHGAGGLRLGRLGATMVVLEIAVSVAMVGAALSTARTALELTSPDIDLPRGEVLTAEVRIERPQPPPAFDGDIEAWQIESMSRTRAAVLDAVRELPGVVASGAATSLPGEFPGREMTQVEPAPNSPPGAPRPAPVVSVLPGYLETLGAEPLLGRLIETTDLEAGARPVVVVNRPFVDRFLGGEHPIGRRIRIVTAGEAEQPAQWREIVGVVGDLGLNLADPSLAAGYYVPLGSRRQFDLAIRAEGDPLQLAPALRAAVVSVHPEITLRRVQALEDVPREEAFFFYLFGVGMMLLGGAALVLSVVGVYAVTSLAVAQRTREIGIRAALGASTGKILTLVSRRAIVHLAIGSVLGAALGIAITQVTGQLSGGLDTGEPWEIPLVAALLGTVVVLACLWPAQRALRINPLDALRDD